MRELLFGLGIVVLAAGGACSAANDTGGAGGSAAASTAASTSGSTSIGGTSTATSGSGGEGGESAASTSAATTSGAGGAGGSGGAGQGGAGGSGGSTPGSGALFALFGAGTQGAASSAWFDAATGWTVTAHPALFTDGAAAAHLQNGDLVAVARQASADPLQDDLLLGAVWTGGASAGFSGLGASFSTKGGPGLGGFVDAAQLVFLGQDNKHYGSVWTAGLFAPPGPVPAGMVQIQAFGPSAATITTDGIDAYAAYAGDDEHVYYVKKTGPGGAWAASSQVPTGLVKNALPPAIVLDGAGKVYFFFVRKADAKIAFVTLTTPQMTWSAETLVDANALTQSAVTATRTATGDVLVAWHGYNDQGLYFARGTEAGFSVPAAIELPAGNSTLPVAVSGVAGADAEVLYGVGGNTAKHARLTGAQWDIAPIAGVTAVSFVAAAATE